MEGNVVHEGALDDHIGEVTLDDSVQLLRRDAVVGAGEDAPVLLHLRRSQVEEPLCPLGVGYLGKPPAQAQVPFRRAVGELPDVDPEVPFPVGDDVADLHVAVKEGRRVRNLLQQGQGEVLQDGRHHALAGIELLHPRLHRRDAGDVGGHGVEGLAVPGEAQRNLLQPFRLLGDDAAVGAFPFDKFVFRPDALAVGNQPVQPRRRNACLVCGLRRMEFLDGDFRIKPGVEQFGEALFPLMGISHPLSPFAAVGIILQMDSLVLTHCKYLLCRVAMSS